MANTACANVPETTSAQARASVENRIVSSLMCGVRLVWHAGRLWTRGGSKAVCLLQPEQAHRVLLQDERPHLVADGDLLEIGKPGSGRQHPVVGSEPPLVLEERIRIPDKRRREVLRRPAREIDVPLRFVQADG